jgi:membrane associated rhomboid family serine protease
MPRAGATQFALPDFHGATRRLVLANLFAYFALALVGLALPSASVGLFRGLAFDPYAFLHGAFWQPFTYSLVHFGLLGTLFELLSLWFLAGFLENFHAASWVTNLYVVSVLGTAVAATVLYACSGPLGFSLAEVPLAGCLGGIFGLLVAIGALYGDVQFLLFFVIGIKAKYLVAIYALVSIAMLFGEQRMYAFAQLGGALAGLLYVRLAPRRGASFAFSEKWYGLRNRFYRWKRRRASRKFEVYMRSQGRNIHIDGYGRPIDKDPDDKKHWN